MTPPRVLIIDDDRTMVALMTALLRKSGFQVLAAFDGASGLMIAQKQLPNLILLDVQMPAGGGAVVWDRLSASARTQGIPVVYVTGTATPGYDEEVKAQGAAGYIQKPFDPATFAETVKTFFKRATGEFEVPKE